MKTGKYLLKYMTTTARIETHTQSLNLKCLCLKTGEALTNDKTPAHGVQSMVKGSRLIQHFPVTSIVYTL